jgi:carboxyl-terminal processing protease
MTRVSTTVRWFLVFATGLLFGFGLSIGRPVQADRAAAVQQNTRTTVRWQDARLLAEVLEHVRKEYVDDIPDEVLITAAIKGLMADLDPHSSFLGPDQLRDMRISTRGEYSGVGIEVTAENGTVRVVAPMEGGPAALAGVQAGDRILAIDGIPVDPENLNTTIDQMRGKVGSMVRLTLMRSPDAPPLELSIKRAKVQVSSVKAHLAEPDIGYVRITHFSETTAADLDRAVAQLIAGNGSKLAGLVLDLRDNPGGLLEAGVAVADAFLDAGLIVTAEGRAHDARFSMSAKKGDLIDGAPLTVLVNGDSASASEIVAGALRDHRRATLVGQQTYGKGSVQTVVPLSGGYALKLTTSRYYTPSGESIHKTGITPDVVIDSQQTASTASGDPASDYALRVALETTKQAVQPGLALAASQVR